MKIEELFSPDKIYITTAVLATIGLFAVSVLIGVTTRRRQRQAMDHVRFRPRRRLMEGAEKRCFQLLVDLFGKKFYIIPQVELSALLNHKVGTQDRTQAKKFLENKTVDFVLCNKRTLRPICAVKLTEDPVSGPIKHSHDADATTNDAPFSGRKAPGNSPADFEKFFRSAHLPFVYLPKSSTISRQRVIDEFSRVIYETSLLPSKK